MPCPRAHALRAITPLLLLVLAAPGVAAAPVQGCSGGGAGGDWPLPGRDLTNSRSQPAERQLGPAEVADLGVAWTFSVRRAGAGGDITGTPIVAGGCTYVATNGGWVIAVDLDDGSVAWRHRLAQGGAVNNTLAAADGRVFAHVSRVGSPYVVALDASTGTLLWEAVVDTQPGADAFAAPTVFDGIVVVGVSGDAAQHGDSGERAGLRGSLVLLQADTGERLAKIWTVPEDAPPGQAGATVSTTPAIDAGMRRAYVGTSSPYVPQQRPDNAEAVLAIDLDRTSPTFATIVGRYHGDTYDDVVPGYSALPCVDLPTPAPPPIVPTGRGIGACGDVDVDFAAYPTLLRVGARSILSAPQKSGTHHLVDAGELTGVHRVRVGLPQVFGGVSGATDGELVFGGVTPPSEVYALDPVTGRQRWRSPIPDGFHYGLPLTHADGVVYTLTVAGALAAYDATDGRLLAHRPLPLEAETGAQPTVTFGGVAVARHTVLAAVGLQSTGLDPTGDLDGFVVAFRRHDVQTPRAVTGR